MVVAPVTSSTRTHHTNSLPYGAPNRSTMAEIAAATTAVQSSSGQRQSMTLVFLCFRLFPRGVKLTSKCLGIFIRIFQSDRATRSFRRVPTREASPRFSVNPAHTRSDLISTLSSGVPRHHLHWPRHHSHTPHDLRQDSSVGSGSPAVQIWK